MENIVLVVLTFLAISGWAFSVYVNDSWFKDSIKTSEDWFNHCMEVNNTWYEHSVKLAEKVDKLIAENNRIKNQLKEIELGEEGE